tara:strand:- start:44 stop:5047 length:5004 start_codon:yes stop_codon:yes gene_type:complete
MAEDNKKEIPTYGVQPTADETRPFEEFDTETGGYKLTNVDVDSGTTAYKYSPPTETMSGVSKEQFPIGLPASDAPRWKTIKHIEADTSVPLYLEDGVTRNPDKVYSTIILDRYGQHIQFSGTKQQNKERAETWDFVHQDLENSDFPRQEFITYGPSNDPTDSGLPFIPSEREKGKGNPMDSRIGERRKNTVDKQLSEAFDPDNLRKRSIQIETRGDIRGRETATGKYRYHKSLYFPNLVKRFGLKVPGMLLDVGNMALLGVSNLPKLLGIATEGVEFGVEKFKEGVGVVTGSKTLFDNTEKNQKLRAEREYGISQYLFKATEWTKENAYSRVPNSYDLFAATIAQPTQKEYDRGVAAWRGQDLQTFFENPNQSAIGKIAIEFGAGYGFMKGLNVLLKTVPKGITTYNHYLNKGKLQFFDDLEAQRINALSKKEGPTFTIPKTLKEKQKAWEELSSIQQDGYAKNSLLKGLQDIQMDKGAKWWSTSTGPYRYFTENMRFENGRKLLLSGPEYSIANPRNIFRSKKDSKNIKVSPFPNYFAGEEFHGNVSASIGAVAGGELFKNIFGGYETAGYLLGAVSFAFGGTRAFNSNWGVLQKFPRDVGETLLTGVPFSAILRQGLSKEGKFLDEVQYTDAETGKKRNLNDYEKTQINHVIDAIKAMSPERQERTLAGFDAYRNLINKLEAQGGDSSKLALKIAQVSDMSTLRAIQEDLVDKVNLGIGVNLNIKKLQQSFDEEESFFREISDLTKKILKTKTISVLGEETDLALKNMNEYFESEIRMLNEQYGELNNVNQIFMSLGNASLYKSLNFTESYDELFAKQNTKVKLAILNRLKIENVDPDSPKAAELVRAEYKKLQTIQNEAFDKWTNDGITEFKVNEAAAGNEASDFVGAYEKRRLQIETAGNILYGPIMVKIDKAGTMDITDWVDNFIIDEESLIDASKLPANRIIDKTLPNDFQYLIPQILGEELGVQIDSMMHEIAKESGETSLKAVRNSIKAEYNIDPSNPLEFYRWIKKGGKEAEEFLSKHSEALGENYTFNKIEVSAQSLVNIRRKLSGHKSRLKQKIDNAPLAADLTSTQNAYEILNTFDTQFDTLFSSSYGEGAGKLLQEFKEVSTEWGNTLAQLKYNDFSYELARYGRTYPKGEFSTYGSNRAYGDKGVGKNPIEWGDYILNLVHTGDARKAGRMLNEAFGQKITLQNGSTAFKIVDATAQKNVAKLIDSAIERQTTRLGSDYFTTITTKLDRNVPDLDPIIVKMMAGEQTLMDELSIPDGASYKLITDSGSPVQYTKKTNVFDTSGSQAFAKRMRNIMDNSPEGKEILRAAGTKWASAGLEVMGEVDKMKLDIDSKQEILTGFFKGQGISYKPGSFNIKKAYSQFTEGGTGSVVLIKQYKKYFFEANKASKRPLSKAAVEKQWKNHIRSVMVRGFLDNHTEVLKGSNSYKKMVNKKSIGDASDADDSWINEPDLMLKADAGGHLRDYENVFVEAMGQKQYDDLLDIITFVDISRQGQTGRSIPVMNIPVDMELRAIMSRIYGVVRNVVSKHWVATEFLIHETRGQKGLLLGKLLNSEEVTAFVADSLKNPKAITEQRITKINAILPKVLYQGTVEDSIITDNPNYYDDLPLLNESGQPIRPGTMVPKEGGYGGMPTMNMGGKVSISQQMNNLNFRQ